MTTLYVLGNGFDLMHDMQTRFSNFKKYLSESGKEAQLVKDIEDLFPILCRGENDDSLEWKNFEEALAFTSKTEASKYENLKYQKYFKDELLKWFIEWIKNVNTTHKPAKLLSFNEDDKFITFNYTSILEDPNVYNIDQDKVCHIHNYFIEKYYDSSITLVFGHGNKNLKSDKTISGVLYKNTSECYEKHKFFFENLSSIDEIVVFGFPYSLIDRLYFDKLLEMCPDATWKLNVHTEEDVKNREAFIKAVKIKNYILEEKK